MKSTSWRQNVCYDVKKYRKCVIASSLCKLRHDVKKYKMNTKNPSWQKFIKYIITSKSTSWCHKVCYDVKKYATTSKIWKVCHCLSKRHVLKRYVRSQKVWKVCYDVNKYVMTSKVCHDVKKYGKCVMKSKSASWRKHEKYVMTS